MSVVADVINPPILFFFLGVLGAFLKVPLDFTQGMSRFLSLYLLFSIGMKGGIALQGSPVDSSFLPAVAIGIGLAFLIPIWSFAIAKRSCSTANAAAFAASLGSVSAVTFIAAVDFLTGLGIPFPGYMVGILAMMELPAILLCIGMLQRGQFSFKKLIHEALCNPSIFLLIGSFLIGFVARDRDIRALEPFIGLMFQGFLCLFLLSMGLASASHLKTLGRQNKTLIMFSFLLPWIHGLLCLAASAWLGLRPEVGFLLTILTASASYIAVPAAFKMSVPEADSEQFLPLTLGVVFPMNVLVGIPVYWALCQRFL